MEKILEIINRELVVALGCTEPIAIALAAALARKYAGGRIIRINVNASPNVVKNAMSVKIPGTNSCGINLAAALGTLTQDLDKKLELLMDLKDNDMENALKMIESGLVTVQLADSPKKLYIEVFVETEQSKSRVIIEDEHDNVVLIEVDGKKLKNQTIKNVKSSNKESESLKMNFLSLDFILEFVQQIDTRKLGIIKDSIEMNMKICLEGLSKPYGLNVGRSIKSKMELGVLNNDTANYAVALTAAGSDARMAGIGLPAMSNSGSGNQGISATIPVVVFAEAFDSNEDKLMRAVTLSNLITIYIKSKLGRLSALCGATIAATGACCGITYIMGGGEAEIKSAIQNITGNFTGIICDGAKAGCALKVATCTTAAIQSSIVAMQGNTIASTDGLIANNPEDTIENLCLLGNVGMKEADRIILDIMLKKCNCISYCSSFTE